MNERIKQLADEAKMSTYLLAYGLEFNTSIEKFAELIVQDCADFVRETYDHEAAESIAWNMEIKYGLHGDYA